MKRNRPGLLFLFCLCVLFTACSKQKSYPGDTTTGNGTFGAIVANKQLLPCVPLLTSGGAVKTNAWQYSPTVHGITVSARNSCDKNYSYGRTFIVSFDSLAIVENTTYQFGNGNTGRKGQVSCSYSQDLVNYASDSALNGHILVRKFDPVNRIISASFETSLKEKNTGEVITVTQGKFDIRF